MFSIGSHNCIGESDALLLLLLLLLDEGGWTFDTDVVEESC